MAIHIVIDGYNLIRQSSSLEPLDRVSLEEGRHALLELLAMYRRFKTHSVTVVFDGADASSTMGRRERWRGIDIVFSSLGESADTVIKKMAAREKERAVIVTSDRDLAHFVNKQGSSTVESVDFELKMMVAIQGKNDGSSFKRESRSWDPHTKKKGPSRRRSKKERRQRVKARKL